MYQAATFQSDVDSPVALKPRGTRPLSVLSARNSP